MLAPIIPRLRKINGYAGLVVFGSSVERSLSRRSKDIDLIVLVTTDEVGQGKFSIEGLEVDIFLRPIQKCIAEILARRSLFDARNIAPGLLVDWANPMAPLIKKAAEVAWRDGPPRPTPLEWMLLKERWHAWTRLSLSAGKIYQQIPAQLLAAQAAVRDYHSIFGLHLTKWSYLLPRMEILDSSLHSLISSCLESHSQTAEIAVRKLGSYMIGILHGVPPATWIMSEDGARDQDPSRSHDQAFLNAIARYPPPIRALCGSGHVAALIEGGSSRNTLLTIIDWGCSQMEQGVFSHNGCKWSFERINFPEAMRCFGGITEQGVDHRMLDFRIAWSRDQCADSLRRWINLQQQGELPRCSFAEKMMLRREPASMLRQLRELAANDRKIEALYVAGTLLRKCLQVWYRIRGLRNPADDLEALEYLSTSDPEFRGILSQPFFNFEADSGSLTYAMEMIVDAVLRPVGGPIVGDWCYPVDLRQRLGFLDADIR